MRQLRFKPGRLGVGLAIALLVPACTTIQWPRPSDDAPSDDALPEPSSPVVVQRPSPSPVVVIPPDVLEKAATKATSATRLAKTAVTKDDWNLVLLQWQRAIDLLKPVPRSHPSWAKAQQLLARYEKERQQAQIYAKTGTSPRSPVAQNKTTAPAPNIGFVALDGAGAGDEADVAAVMAQLNQQQITFFGQQKRFAKSLSELGRDESAQLANYVINTASGQPNQAISTAIAKQDGLISYIGAVFAVPDEQKRTITVSIVCVTQQPTKTAPALPTLVGKQAQCPAGTQAVTDPENGQQAIAK